MRQRETKKTGGRARRGTARAEELPPRRARARRYLPEWRYEGANWDTLSTHLTHLILFSAEPTPLGELAGLERLPRPAIIEAARAATKKRGCELLVCFGGNGRSSGFPIMVSNPHARETFVANVVKLVEKHKLDGIDYNWERRAARRPRRASRKSPNTVRDDGARVEGDDGAARRAMTTQVPGVPLWEAATT